MVKQAAILLALAAAARAQDEATIRRELLAYAAERAQVAIELDGERFGGLPPAPDPVEVRRIAEGLANESWAAREEATRRLLALGWPALEAVERFEGGPDAELAERLKWVRTELEARRSPLTGLLEAVVPDWGRWERAADGRIVVTGGAPSPRAAAGDLRKRLESVGVGRLDVENAPVESAFEFLEAHGIEVIVDRRVLEAENLRFSLRVADLSALDTMELLLSIGRLRYTAGDGAITILPREGDAEGGIEVVHRLRQDADGARLVRWLRATIAPGSWEVQRSLSIEDGALVARHEPDVQIRIRKALRGLGALPR